MAVRDHLPPSGATPQPCRCTTLSAQLEEPQEVLGVTPFSASPLKYFRNWLPDAVMRFLLLSQLDAEGGQLTAVTVDRG